MAPMAPALLAFHGAKPDFYAVCSQKLGLMSAHGPSVLNPFLPQTKQLNAFQWKHFWAAVHEVHSFDSGELNSEACESVPELTPKSFNNKHLHMVGLQGLGIRLDGKISAAHFAICLFIQFLQSDSPSLQHVFVCRVARCT